MTCSPLPLGSIASTSTAAGSAAVAGAGAESGDSADAGFAGLIAGSSSAATGRIVSVDSAPAKTNTTHAAARPKNRPNLVVSDRFRLRIICTLLERLLGRSHIASAATPNGAFAGSLAHATSASAYSTGLSPAAAASANSS